MLCEKYTYLYSAITAAITITAVISTACCSASRRGAFFQVEWVQ